jgi:protein-S-isoprenylcysteine O-methyltransferase Ste14
MVWRLGEFLYWTATIVAGLIVLLVVANYAYNADKGESIIRTIPLLLAGAIWLVVWACRRVFAGR